MARLVLATCQFPVAADVDRNFGAVARQLRAAKAGGAHLAHFSEACLSGYLGVELASARQVDWERVRARMADVQDLARRLRLWVAIGCNHRLTGRHKPHNSVYVVDGTGALVDRYDKRFCTGASARSGDLAHYSPGQAFVTFQVRGVRCGLLICHDFRYPELFREYRRRGVHLMLVSFHNARMTPAKRRRYDVFVATAIQAAAASNFFPISANNSCARHAWPSFLASAEGLVVDRAPAHRPAVLLNAIDTKARLYDASAAWRDRAMRGVYHSGTLVRDPRSRDRRAL